MAGANHPAVKGIMQLLSDGECHSRESVVAAMGDSQADYAALKYRLNLIKALIHDRGETIVCEAMGQHKTGYRWVKMLVFKPILPTLQNLAHYR